MKSIYSFITFLMFSLSLSAQNNCSNLLPKMSPDYRYIYFSSDRTGTYQIYRSTPRGDSLVQLTSEAVNCFYVSISPDGKRLAYQKGDYGSGEVVIMDADGSNKKKISPATQHAGYPNFSPDGKQIVYEAWDKDNYPEIFVMDTNGNNSKQLTMLPGAFWNSAPVFSPDGKFIYYSKGFNADNYYLRMNADGTGTPDTITPLNSFGYQERILSFDPSGTRMVFYTTEWRGHNNGADVVIADLDGKNWNRITNSAPDEWYLSPCFGKDSSELYYSYRKNSSSSLELNYLKLGSTPVPIQNCWLVGINEINSPEEKPYPNPVQNTLYIPLRTDITKINLNMYNAQGKLVHSANHLNLNGQVEINVSQFANGIYLLELNSGRTKMRTHKIIVTNTP